MARGIEGAAVAPVWETGRLIRDELTGASKGEVDLRCAVGHRAYAAARQLPPLEVRPEAGRLARRGIRCRRRQPILLLWWGWR